MMPASVPCGTSSLPRLLFSKSTLQVYLVVQAVAVFGEMVAVRRGLSIVAEQYCGQCYLGVIRRPLPSINLSANQFSDQEEESLAHLPSPMASLLRPDSKW